MLITEAKEGCYLKVFITPKSSKNQILSIINDELKIKIAAPPEKGKANKELIRFLSRNLKIQKDSISITKGETSRHKTLFLQNCNKTEIQNLIRSHIKVT